MTKGGNLLGVWAKLGPHRMNISESAQKILRFGQFTLNPQMASLSGPVGPVPLRPKAFDVLHYLSRHPGRVVSKDELIGTIWPDVFVTDNSLVQCVRDVRAALGDKGEEVLKTVARRGYLFAQAVVEIDPSPAEPRPGGGEYSGLGVAHDSIPANLMQEIHYARAPDGVRIAWARVGQGPPLLRAANWLTHLEYDWE